MKKLARAAPALALAMVLVVTGARDLKAQVSAGVVLDRDGIRLVHLAIGHVFGTPVRTSHAYLPRGIHPDEIPVVHFIAREARVSPEAVVALRLQGWSWMDISHHLGVRPTVFVRHLPRRGPPHGRAHGYWSRPNRVGYLSDQQIVDYVNLWFWSQYSGMPVVQVIDVRYRYPTWSHLPSRGVVVVQGAHAPPRSGPSMQRSSAPAPPPAVGRGGPPASVPAAGRPGNRGAHERGPRGRP